MSLEKNIDFFNGFLESEFQCSKSRWNIEVSDNSHELVFEKYESYFHSHAYSGGRYDRPPNFFDDLKSKEIEQNYREVRKRILYMVRVYNDYELGENWADLVKENTLLYRFYVSSDTAYEGKELTYISESFFAAETDEGFKIIGRSAYRDGSWWHAVWEIYQIHPGLKAAEIIRLEEPIDEESRNLYFSNENLPIKEYPR